MHRPPRTLREETDKFVFVRDGFHFWALLFGPFWLVWHRLWLVLVGYLAVWSRARHDRVAAGCAGAMRALWCFLLLAILMGLEAASLRRWTYSRRKWRQIDFVVADDEESAERRFFDRWTESNGTSSSPSYTPPTSPWPTRAAPAAPQGIIGLFPEPGGSR